MTATAPPRPDDGDQVGRWETDGGHIEDATDEARHAQAEHVGRQLTAVAERLCREFAPGGGAAAAAVREEVRASRAGFGSPHVISYLPTLVERAVRRRLAASTVRARGR